MEETEKMEETPLEPELLESEEVKKGNTLSVPSGIIIAGLFIAFAIFLSNNKNQPTQASGQNVHAVPVFTACLKAGTSADKIEADVENAEASGGTGTPWTIIVGPTGIKYPVNGALPYSEVKSIVDDALAGKPADALIASAKKVNPQFDEAALLKMNPVISADHIRGNPNAAVKIVEYSDLECPFCKAFQSTLTQIMTDYATSNNVAWVYRHFPLDSLHPRSRNESVAAECAYDQGGDTAFFAYIDRVYDVTTSNNTLDPLELPIIASYVGLK